jgi:hypothetical protein
MFKFLYYIPLLIQLFLFELAHAENNKTHNLLFSEYNVFEFVLINYSNITHDVIMGDGEYLNALYQYSQCHQSEYIFKSLKDSLLKPHSIADFSRYSAELLNCKKKT